MKDAIPCEYSCADTFSFLNDLKKFDLKDRFTVSFDVCSLFTNLPLEETLDLAVDLLFEKKNRI